MKKLRLQMIKVVVASTIAVFAVVLVCIYGFSYHNTISDADTITEMIANNGGKMMRPGDIEFDQKRDKGMFSTLLLNEESEYTTRFFVVYLDENLNNFKASLEFIASVSREEAQEMATDALKQGKEVGFCGEYRYRVCEVDDEEDSWGLDLGKYIIFLNCSNEINQVVALVCVVSLLSIVLVLLISVVFIFASKWVIRPFAENALKQRQFITDAGHELKTPLAIISANADVLDYKAPENKEWTQKIKDEVKNLNKLIAQLLFLSKAEEIDNNITVDEVRFSEIVMEANLDFENVFKGRNVTVDSSRVEKNVTVNANYEGIDRMVSILFDNCAKYVPENGKVILELKKTARNVLFSISNTDGNNEKIDCERLFDRFYRSDSSRNSKTGGHGIGLSIAKRVCLQHKGDIVCEQKNGMVTFITTIPTNLKNNK